MLRVTNTLTRTKEVFVPIREGNVAIYVCGPTVYGPPHFGHAKSYVSFDVVVRYLRYLGYNVLYVQNITDVGHLTDDADEGEDKLVKKSRQVKRHPMQLAEQYTYQYFRDMDLLNVMRPDISPRATGHIPEMIGQIQVLLEKGFAYEANGSVYYDVSKFPKYGSLSGRKIDEIVSGTRVEARAEKKHPADFALWKKAEPDHIMQWPSPWGLGFPGWHIECSVMSAKYLGVPFDIHGGGMDNQFPHHECEIAQSESATGTPFARYWIHNNLVTVKGQKMGKSLGNFVTLEDAFKRFSPMGIRFFILQSHYRSTLDFTEEALQAALNGYDKLMQTVRLLRSKASGTSADALRNTTAHTACEELRKKFREAMDDDFNTPTAIATLFEAVGEVNVLLNAETPPPASVLTEYDSLLRELGGRILGIIPDSLEELRGDMTSTIEALVQLAISARAEARKYKMYDLADSIRKNLENAGILLEDRRDETIWKFKT